MALETAVGKFCAGVWASPERGKLLVLAGANGSGKTHSANAIDNWIRSVGHKKQFVPRQDYVTYLRCGFHYWPQFLDHLKEGQWDLVDEAVNIPVLILDELGGGHDPSRVGIDKLCQILSRRQERWTLITTNVTPESWEELFDKRIASRFFRYSEIVDLSGVPDYCLS